MPRYMHRRYAAERTGLPAGVFVRPVVWEVCGKSGFESKYVILTLIVLATTISGCAHECRPRPSCAEHHFFISEASVLDITRASLLVSKRTVIGGHT